MLQNPKYYFEVQVNIHWEHERWGGYKTTLNRGRSGRLKQWLTRFQVLKWAEET